MNHRPLPGRACDTCGVRWPCLEAQQRAIAAAKLRAVAARIDRGERVRSVIVCTRGARQSA